MCKQLTHVTWIGRTRTLYVYLRYFWQGNHQTYGRNWMYICIVLANPKHDVSGILSSWPVLCNWNLIMRKWSWGTWSWGSDHEELIVRKWSWGLDHEDLIMRNLIMRHLTVRKWSWGTDHEVVVMRNSFMRKWEPFIKPVPQWSLAQQLHYLRVCKAATSVILI